MELGLAGATVMVLGTGDSLTRALLRTLSEEGVRTYATQAAASGEDLTQEGISLSHWVVPEDSVDSGVVSRSLRFLADRDIVPDALVMQMDVDGALAARGFWGWRGLRATMKDILRSARDALLVAAGPERFLRVVIVYRLGSTFEYGVASRWLDRTTAAIVRRAPETTRVNSIVLAPGRTDASTAALIAVLCSPLASSVSGAFIPVDDGTLIRDHASRSEQT